MKKSQIVYKHIEEKILKGIWKPGDKINTELELVKELEVSRNSIREAVEKMVALGILTKQQGGGTFVNKVKASTLMSTLMPLLTLDNMNYSEILEFRLLVDTYAIKNFCRNENEEAIKELRKIYAVLSEKKRNHKNFIDEYIKFHKIIAQGSNNSIIYMVTEVLFDVGKYYMEEGILSVDIEDYRYIMRSIEEREGDVGAVYIKKHIKKLFKIIKF